MKPYPTYKPAAVPWLQQVPEHWEVLPNRALFAEVNEVGRPEDEMLSVTIGRGVLKQAEHLATTTKKDSSRKDRSTYKRVGEGDIVYNKMRAWQGAFGMSRYSGIVSPAYVVQRPRPKAVSEFYHYLMRTPLFAKEAERNSYGLASDIWNLRPEHFKGILNVCPPPDEQHLIVRYLHALDAKVKRYIRTKRKLIAALQEQKQAIIQRAVTRGLDPNVKLKPSGVEWLGEVPVHWEVVKLKRLATVKGRIGFRGYTTGDLVEKGKGALALGASHITSAGGVNVADPVFISWEKYHESPEIMVDRNDLIVVQRGSCGKVALVDADLGPATINPSLVLLKRLKVEPKFLLNVLLGGYIQNIIASQTSSTAVPMLSQKQIENFDVLLPPRAEQLDIVELLTRETFKVDQPLARAERAIARMQEYHTRLIADVVTGAVDVREAARKLPEEDQMIGRSDDQMMEEEEPLSMAAEGEAEYGAVE